jgi:hypothetical protein
MKYPKYVQVSHDAPDEWWDPKAQMWLRKSDDIIELSDDIDATNIVRYLRLNYLIDATHLKFPKIPAIEEFNPSIEKTPNQLLAEVEDKAAKLQVDGKDAELEVVPVEDAVPEEIVKDKEICPYCGKEYSIKGIATHKKNCKKNPDNNQ